MLLDLDQIRITGGTQLRAEIDEATVAEYAEVADELPAATVFFDGADYWLSDGFHRFHAMAKAKKKNMEVDVKTGTLREAILFAAGANDSHGMRRKPEDKEKAVNALLDDEEWRGKSDRWIAETAKVSNHFVAKVRGKWDSAHSGNGQTGIQTNPSGSGGNVPTSNSGGKKTGKDGKNYGSSGGGARPARSEVDEKEDHKRIRAYFTEHPGAKNREVARELEVSDHTVAAVKKKIISEILCERHKRVGKPLDQECKDCEESRKNFGKPKVQPESLLPAEDESPWVDAWGIPITKQAAPVFRDVEKFDELLKKLRECRKLFKELADLPGGAYLLQAGISINARDSYKHAGIETAIRNIADCKPTYTVCPYAYSDAEGYKHNKNCTLCHGLGWTRPLGKEEVPESLIKAAKEANGIEV